MTVRNPEEIDAVFEQEMNAGSVEGLLALYEPGAVFTPEPGKTVAGHAAIREALSGFLALKPSIRLHPKVLANTGEIALISSRWTLKGTGPDGSPLDLSADSAEVVRKQADGTWKFVVDNPWGLA